MVSRRTILQNLAATSLLPAFPSPLFAQQSMSLKGVYSAPGLSYAAIYIADALQLWAKNGISAELRQVQGGPLAMVALTNKEAQFAGVASTDPIVAIDKGIKSLTVGAFTGSLAMQIAARNDWLSKMGLSKSSSLEAKLKALKSARIGASTIGGGPAQYTRYMAKSVGLNPEQDLRILAVGLGAARIAALRTNQVDVIVGSAPDADQVALEGFGELYIDCAHELPIFKEFPYTVATVSTAFAMENPTAISKIMDVFGQANNMFSTNFGQVFDILKPMFPNIPAKALELALERDKDTYPKNCRMTKAMWDNNVQVSLDIKMITKPLDVSEGGFWTNRFIRQT
jgi:NitT/TauT family transport system substrate-binding protein